MEGDLLRTAQKQPDLGLPLGTTVLRRLKRLVVRRYWVFFHRQVAYNLEGIRAWPLVAKRSINRQSRLEELHRQLAWKQTDLLNERTAARAASDKVGALSGEQNARRGDLAFAAQATGSNQTSTTVPKERTQSSPVSRTGSLSSPQRGDRPTLSVCCVTRDGSPSVVALLDQLRPVVDEIFVAVDSRAEPATLKPLVKVVDRVKRFEYAPPFERTLAWAHAQCGGDWVFRIDSDEVASPDLVEALPELIRARDVVYYAFPRRWLYPNTASWLDEYPWSFDYQIRLVRNDPALLWHDGSVHAGTCPTGPGRYLEWPFYHLYCAISTKEDRETKVAGYRADHLRPVEPGPEHLYLPERYATKPPRAVTRRDFDAITEVVGASERAPGLVPTSLEFPIAQRDEIDNYWDRRPLTENTYRASIEVLERDIQLSVGYRRYFPVRVTNLGHETWPGGFDRHPLVRVGYHWRRLDGDEVVEGGDRSYLTAGLGPGTSSVIPVAVEAPEHPGLYMLEVDLVHEGVRWFDCPAQAAVVVTTDSPRWLTDHG